MSVPPGTGTSSPDLLADRYVLGAVLGVGGMAEVREGTDVRLGRTVALKVLRPDLARDPTFLERFRREAQAAASLNHPSIVSVYDTGEDRGVPFIVMERVEGRTLREVLQTEGRLLPQRALEVVADVCLALQVAHEAGIVHRDVKPGNVMLTPAGEVKVMDFGIARAVADSAVTMTQTAAVIGTAAYLSPEQARGEHTDARSDLYSTGCLLYELVTGAPPFTGDSPVAVAYQHVREDPVPPTEYDADLSPDVDAVVLKSMAKNPANRYQSAAEMRDDLLRAVAGEPVAATPVLIEADDGLRATTIVPAPAGARPGEPGSAKRVVVYGLFGAVLLALLLAVALLVRGLLANDTGVVPAPELVGLTQAQAVEELADRGLRVGEVTLRFAEKPAGTVLAQSPNDGIVVPREGGTVDLVLSKGVDVTVVPVVVGLDRDAALAALEENRLGIGEVQFRDGNIPAGQVLEVQPPAGRPRRAGATVDLVVASGKVTVPDVRGRSEEEAVKLLRAAGLSVAVEPVPAPGPVDRVIGQTPVGVTLDRSSVVQIEVSVEQPPSPSPVPVPVQPTAAPSASTAPPPQQPAPQPTPQPSPTA